MRMPDNSETSLSRTPFGDEDKTYKVHSAVLVGLLEQYSEVQ